MASGPTGFFLPPTIERLFRFVSFWYNIAHLFSRMSKNCYK